MERNDEKMGQKDREYAAAVDKRGPGGYFRGQDRINPITPASGLKLLIEHIASLFLKTKQACLVQKQCLTVHDTEVLYKMQIIRIGIFLTRSCTVHKINIFCIRSSQWLE
jgi:hypothetical protein